MADAKTETTETTEPPRYDILIVSDKPHYQLAPRGAESLIRFLVGKRWVCGGEEAIAETWAEIYLAPGPYAQEIFTKEGPPAEGVPVFHELAVRVGNRAVPAPGYPSESVFFYIELRGCLYKEPLGPFRRNLKEFLQFRPVVHTRPHEGLPPHTEVPEDELPKEREKAPPLGGTVGTRVEEL